MNAIAVYYDIKVTYNNDLIFNFMNFNENFINSNGKVGKLNG